MILVGCNCAMVNLSFALHQRCSTVVFNLFAGAEPQGNIVVAQGTLVQ